VSPTAHTPPDAQSVLVVAVKTQRSRPPDFWQRKTPALVVLTRPSVVHDPPGPGAADVGPGHPTPVQTMMAATAHQRRTTRPGMRSF
jgi:hypothetical protein